MRLGLDQLGEREPGGGRRQYQMLAELVGAQAHESRVREVLLTTTLHRRRRAGAVGGDGIRSRLARCGPDAPGWSPAATEQRAPAAWSRRPLPHPPVASACGEVSTELRGR